MGEEKNLVGMCFKNSSEVKFNKNVIKWTESPNKQITKQLSIYV